MTTSIGAVIQMMSTKAARQNRLNGVAAVHRGRAAEEMLRVLRDRGRARAARTLRGTLQADRAFRRRRSTNGGSTQWRSCMIAWRIPRPLTLVLVAILVTGNWEDLLANTRNQSQGQRLERVRVKSEDLPNDDIVRKAVIRWGIGQELVVKAADLKTIRGRIDQIEADSFMLRISGRSRVRVQFGEVTTIRRPKTVPVWGTLLILTGAVVTGFVIYTLDQLKHWS